MLARSAPDPSVGSVAVAPAELIRSRRVSSCIFTADPPFRLSAAPASLNPQPTMKRARRALSSSECRLPMTSYSPGSTIHPFTAS